MTIRILYVDDEPDIAEVAAMALELDPKFEVRTCSSGIAALAAAPDFKPDLIMLDVMMPDMDGPATFAALRSMPEATEVPVVFITARAQGREVEHLKALGAVDVIAKPFDPMTLALQVRQLLRR